MDTLAIGLCGMSKDCIKWIFSLFVTMWFIGGFGAGQEGGKNLMTLSSVIACAEYFLEAASPECFSGAKYISITAIFN